MSTQLTPTHQIGTTLVVNIANTVGQESAIEANGGPVFTIEVTDSPLTWEEPTGTQFMLGMGRVVSSGPVNGHEVGFLPGSEVA